MGDSWDRLRGVVHRRLRSGRLVYGVGAQTRLCPLCRLPDYYWRARAGLGQGHDRALVTPVSDFSFTIARPLEPVQSCNLFSRLRLYGAAVETVSAVMKLRCTL